MAHVYNFSQKKKQSQSGTGSGGDRLSVNESSDPFANRGGPDPRLLAAVNRTSVNALSGVVPGGSPSLTGAQLGSIVGGGGSFVGGGSLHGSPSFGGRKISTSGGGGASRRTSKNVESTSVGGQGKESSGMLGGGGFPSGKNQIPRALSASDSE